MTSDVGTTPEGDDGLAGWVRDILRCPVTGATLIDGTSPDGEPELHSTASERPLAYPVRGGIPVLLESDAREL
ncbi:Trm112 family protein [Myceligenerans halotolerans]